MTKVAPSNAIDVIMEYDLIINTQDVNVVKNSYQDVIKQSLDNLRQNLEKDFEDYFKKHSL